MQRYYVEYFLQYCRFISKDLLATFDKRLGRNPKVINTFLKVFFAINKPETKDLKQNKLLHRKKEKVLNALTAQIDHYLSDGDTIIYKKMSQSIKCEALDFVKSLPFLNQLTVSIDDFYKASADFNQVHKDVLFKQGLIEFNNSISHLFKGIITSESNFEKNINKACTHLHRGSLDFYKTLIKNKESLTFLQKEELVRIRTLEIKSVGLEVIEDIRNTNKTKKDLILIKYRDFARELHNLQEASS